MGIVSRQRSTLTEREYAEYRKAFWLRKAGQESVCQLILDDWDDMANLPSLDQSALVTLGVDGSGKAE